MLSAHGLSCVRGNIRLFADLDFSLNTGEWIHVRGENGAGKTSLLRILAGLSQAAAGDIQWDGASIKDDRQKFRSALLYFGHQSALKEDLTGFENLVLSAAVDGQKLSEMDALKALHRFGLKGREDLPVRVLSAGQKRRVMLARITSRKSKLWILDEPFTALDVRAVELLSQVIREHLAAGGMAVLTSHQTMPIEGGRVLQI